ncbi:MAG: DNA polymerase I [Candidatus Omnitrophica bacterium]|nr:DNA polymerase I [Candidatus Omnitrophota bacterium]
MPPVGRAGRLFLIDGTSYTYRAFYAIRSLSTSQGLPTNAVYGFLLMLRRLLELEQPEYLGVAFDLKGPTFRHAQYKEYKVRRKPMPDPLVSQLPLIRDLLAAYRVPVYDCQGYEADDVLGTLARQAVERGVDTYVVTADKDALQLVGPRVTVYRLEGDDRMLMNAEQVEAQWGVPPDRLVDVFALCGDQTDDVKGVPGIGPGRAVELVKQYGSLDAVLQRLASVEPASRRQALQAHHDRIALNRTLVTIRTDVPITLDLAALRRQPPDEARLYTLFRQWEFKRLVREVAPAAETAAPWTRVADAAAAGALAARLRAAGTIAVQPVWQGRGVLAGCAIGLRGEEAVYADFTGPEVAAALATVLADPAVVKLGHDLKSLRVGLAKAGISLAGDTFDTMVAAYLVDPSKGRYPIEALAADSLERVLPPEAPGTVEPAIQHARAVRALVPILQEALAARELTALYREIEHPLIAVLAAMERAGVALDVEVLRQLSGELTQTLDRLTAEIHEIAGRPFNINSPKQLSALLFQDLKLPVLKRTKTGASTDEDVLQRLAAQHALPAAILRYRELAKLKSTYVDALPALLDPTTGRLHATFNQTVTATGRLSSSDPNVQNIPIRTDVGRRIRRAFISRWPDGWLLAADYSQIELRVLAHLSGDEALAAAFRAGQDVHRVTASQVFHIAPESVSEAQRAAAKTINFGIVYGMSPFGLSKALGVEVGEAEAFITQYFQRYPQVKVYFERVLDDARRLGYCTTLCRRRRYIPQLASDNLQVRQFAERTAINAPIQGSAADLIKGAMLRIHEALQARALRAVMVLQVHDELVFDVPPDELETVRAIVTDLMLSACSLSVPVEVHVNAGRNWLEAAH